MDQQQLNIAWIVISAAFVFVMQGGFCCMESGLVRSKNSINVAIKNLMDFCLAAIIFFAWGFAVMFGESNGGWFGTTRFFLDDSVAPWMLAFFLFQIMFCGTATTIVSGAVAERMKFTGYMIVSAVVAGLVYPFVGHWVWGGTESGTTTGWLAKLGFIDFAGSTVVHAVGGWAALVVVILIGPRLGRFGEDRRNLSGHNLPLSVLGVLTLWFGWIGFNGGTTLEFNAQVPLILVNTVLAAAFGGFVGLIVSRVVFNQPDIQHALNGVVSGLVAVTASCHIISPFAAVLIGCIGAMICFWATLLLERLEIDDVIGAFPAHACAGMWGTAAVALFGNTMAFDGFTRWEQLGIQFIGIIACSLWTVCVTLTSLCLINRWCPLRVSDEEERTGLNVAEHDARTEILELLTQIQSLQDASDHRIVTADQHTEAGQIAALYNRMAGTAQRANQTAALMRNSEQRIRKIIDTANDAFIATDVHGLVQRWNSAACKMFGRTVDEAIGCHIEALIVPERMKNETDVFGQCREAASEGCRVELTAANRNGNEFPVELSASMSIHDDEATFNIFIQDISRRQQMQHQLAQAQKLESIGQLAAGIAHEINTPTQFVGDNIRFLQDAFTDLDRAIDAFQRLVDAEKNGQETQPIVDEIDSIIEEIDLAYLDDEIPTSIEQSLDGVDRVASIVRAMKQFSHPGNKKERVDLNQSIDSTITVSRNEWKYVANLERQFDDSLPQVLCYPNEINQVVLNVVVNAAHAIQEKNGEHSAERGTIIVATALDEDHVEIRISDTGCGMPDEVKAKVFDPFFTTKPVGRGTGQGLSIAYHAIVETHGGTIDVHSVDGEGTTFVIRLPLEAELATV